MSTVYDMIREEVEHDVEFCEFFNGAVGAVDASERANLVRNNAGSFISLARKFVMLNNLWQMAEDGLGQAQDSARSRAGVIAFTNSMIESAISSIESGSPERALKLLKLQQDITNNIFNESEES